MHVGEEHDGLVAELLDHVRIDVFLRVGGRPVRLLGSLPDHQRTPSHASPPIQGSDNDLAKR